MKMHPEDFAKLEKAVGPLSRSTPRKDTMSPAAHRYPFSIQDEYSRANALALTKACWSARERARKAWATVEALGGFGEAVPCDPPHLGWVHEVGDTLVQAFGWMRDDEDGLLYSPLGEICLDLRPEGWFASQQEHDYEIEGTWDEFQPRSNTQAAFAAAYIEEECLDHRSGLDAPLP